MNRSAMIKQTFALCAALSLALSGCGQAGPDYSQAPLAGAALGGPFTLVDSAGKTVKWEDFDGKFRILYFGYTKCPAICPTDVLQMAQGYELFKKEHPDLAKDVQPIFITVDPARDTPEVVGEFTRAFSDDLLGLTGPAAEIDKAAKAFAVPYSKYDIKSDDVYEMQHSRAAYLMGRKGEPIALLPVDQGREAVAAELAKWVS